MKLRVTSWVLCLLWLCYAIPSGYGFVGCVIGGALIGAVVEMYSWLPLSQGK